MKCLSFKALMKRSFIKVQFSNPATGVKKFPDKVFMAELKFAIMERTTFMKFETNQKSESLSEVFQLSGGRRLKGCGLFLNQEASDTKNLPIGTMTEEVETLVTEKHLF